MFDFNKLLVVTDKVTDEVGPVIEACGSYDKDLSNLFICCPDSSDAEIMQYIEQLPNHNYALRLFKKNKEKGFKAIYMYEKWTSLTKEFVDYYGSPQALLDAVLGKPIEDITDYESGYEGYEGYESSSGDGSSYDGLESDSFDYSAYDNTSVSLAKDYEPESEYESEYESDFEYESESEYEPNDYVPEPEPEPEPVPEPVPVESVEPVTPVAPVAAVSSTPETLAQPIPNWSVTDEDFDELLLMVRSITRTLGIKDFDDAGTLTEDDLMIAANYVNQLSAQTVRDGLITILVNAKTKADKRVMTRFLELFLCWIKINNITR